MHAVRLTTVEGPHITPGERKDLGELGAWEDFMEES